MGSIRGYVRPLFLSPFYTLFVSSFRIKKILFLLICVLGTLLLFDLYTLPRERGLLTKLQFPSSRTKCTIVYFRFLSRYNHTKFLLKQEKVGHRVQISLHTHTFNIPCVNTTNWLTNPKKNHSFFLTYLIEYGVWKGPWRVEQR